MTAPRLTRRQLLLPGLVLVHVALFITAGRERVLPVVEPLAALTATEIADPAPPSLPVEVTLFPIAAAVEAPVLTESDPAPAPSSLAGQAQAASGCDLSGEVQAKLRASPAVAAALQRIPVNARSVADAVMLWDGHWVDAGSIGGSGALDPVRAAVAAAVQAAPPACRAALVTGPRLLIVPGTTGNQVLAFGSGQWTWAQLLDG